ncbi:hypothetical protein AGMMS49942_21820 [Spirochaetia bacterium]|nr:hypothetical protein AGMMS49942_21820 [Spirochaetia bacterium]
MACRAGLPVPAAILLGLGMGLLIGFLNGIIIVKSGIPPLIVTLGMQYAAKGLVQVIRIKVIPITVIRVKPEERSTLNRFAPELNVGFTRVTAPMYRMSMIMMLLSCR